MSYFKKIGFFIITFFIAIIISQCSSAQKLQTSLPSQIGDVYYQNWVSGVKEGGSGTIIYIQIISESNQIELDNVYFQGKVAKLELTDNMFAVGRFNSIMKSKGDTVMSSDPNAEYGNKVPELPKKAPFVLKDNQCVISYKEGNKIKYFKIDNIRKKELLAYPSSPNNKE
ncbi:hypothetical protein V8G69_02070 [Gaetbulibacter sp. M235]|uniref:hypothetical protein n=1 Tax=Gaetbulibacter sp. M235 TaxID=3126510 RepID=UPI00374F9274